MRILLVHNFHRHGGGSDVVVRQTERLLSSRGHDVGTFYRNDAELARLPGGRWRAFRDAFGSPRTLEDFRRTVSTFRPDIVHAHEVYPFISPRVFAVAASLGTATVLTCHDYRLTCPVYTQFRAGRVCTRCLAVGEVACVLGNCAGAPMTSLSYALRNAYARRRRSFSPVDVFLTPSKFTRAWLVDRARLPADRCMAVGNPVGHSGTPAAPYDPLRRHAAGYIGRLSAEKGVNVLVRAAEAAGVPLRVAGGGDLQTPATGDMVEWVGVLPETGLPTSVTPCGSPSCRASGSRASALC